MTGFTSVTQEVPFLVQLYYSCTATVLLYCCTAVLFCTVLLCAVLLHHCTVLRCTVLFYTTRYYCLTPLHCTVLYCTVLYCIYWGTVVYYYTTELQYT